MDSNKLKIFVEGLLRSNNITISNKCNHDDVLTQIMIYLDALIFNIISIACIISIINNTKSINKENLPIIRHYIEDKCQFKYRKTKKSGGTFNTAAFYGAVEPMYSENNKGGDILGINWSEGLIRPAIGDNSTQNGGGKKINNMSFKYIKMHVNNVLNYHKISASKHILNELIMIIDYHIKCLITNIKQCDKELTLKCLNKIINKNKILSPLK